MTPLLTRLSLLIAALDLNDAEINELILQVQTCEPDLMKSAIYRAKELNGRPRPSDTSGEKVAETKNSSTPEKSRKRSSSLDKLVSRINDLLRNEAGLSALQSAQLLAGAFPEAAISIGSEPGKAGLRRWLSSLLEIVNGSDVLKFLETYLGSRRSGVQTDWTIGGRR